MQWPWLSLPWQMLLLATTQCVTATLAAILLGILSHVSKTETAALGVRSSSPLSAPSNNDDKESSSLMTVDGSSDTQSGGGGVIQASHVDVGSRPFWQQTWFPWVAGTVAAVFLCSLILLLICTCWCLWKRHQGFHEKASSVLGLSVHSNKSGAGGKDVVVGSNSREQFTLNTGNVSLPFISTQVAPIQPPVGGGTGNIVGGIGSLTVINNPQLPLTRPEEIRPSPPFTGASLVGRRRINNRGLFESRRGSHTSLTLSLSSSADSIPSSLSGRGQQQEQEALRDATAMLSPTQLREKLQESNRNLLYKEFCALPMNYASRHDIAIPNVLQKTRYQIVPNEPTRVILPLLNGDPLTTYINANYITGYKNTKCAFIATEGPITSTIVDFWRMVWITNTSIIVMITNLVEKKKTKCEPYFPELDSQTYGSFQIHVQSCERKDGYSVRKMLIKHVNEGERLIYHYWYTGWLDHTTPSTAPQLVQLMQECRLMQERTARQQQTASTPSPPHRHFQSRTSTSSSSSPHSPVLVHCSAGLGRTGCFIALWISCDQLFVEGQVDVLANVAKLRLQRGGMVQNCEQYEFIHQALHFWWEKVINTPPAPPTPAAAATVGLSSLTATTQQLPHDFVASSLSESTPMNTTTRRRGSAVHSVVPHFSFDVTEMSSGSGGRGRPPGAASTSPPPPPPHPPPPHDDSTNTSTSSGKSSSSNVTHPPEQHKSQLDDTLQR